MPKFIVGSMLMWLAMSGLCVAQSYEIDLSAGSSSVAGGFHHRWPVEGGFTKFGVSALYADDNDTEYKWGAINVAVGNDGWGTGLNGEVGIRGLFGSADEDEDSGNIGAVGFNGMLRYSFPDSVLIIPLELFGSITWAPEILSFRDTERYTEFNLGAGLRVVRNASITLGYHVYRADMDSGSGDWTFDDRVIRLGVALRF